MREGEKARSHLLERVGLEVLEAVDIEDADESAVVAPLCALELLVDAAYHVAEELAIYHLDDRLARVLALLRVVDGHGITLELFLCQDL